MFLSCLKPYAVVLLAWIVTVTNAGAAPSLNTSIPIDLWDVICCGWALKVKLPAPLILAMTGSGWSNGGRLFSLKFPLSNDAFGFNPLTSKILKVYSAPSTVGKTLGIISIGVLSVWPATFVMVTEVPLVIVIKEKKLLFFLALKLFSHLNQ